MVSPGPYAADGSSMVTGTLVVAEERVKEGVRPVIGVGGNVGDACWRMGTSIDLTSLSFGFAGVRWVMTVS